jgi:enoyl-CoA hydratase/carnithine racemase
MAVTAEVEDRVGWTTLDRPPANSYDPAFLEELDEAIGRVAAAGVVVGVVRSAS